MNRILLSIFLLFAVSFSQSDKRLHIKKSSPASVPSATLLNVNNFSAWYVSDGTMEYNPNTGNSGGMYPKGSVGAIYSSGLLWGGYINDGVMDVNQPRVNGQKYISGTKPGAIIGTRTGVTENPSDSTVRIYRIRKDIATVDLKPFLDELDCPICLLPDNPDPVGTLYRQYIKDWKEWPAHKGAPFYDAEKDGKYEPKLVMVNGKEVPLLYPFADEPGYANADQVLWFVANDARDSLSPWKTKSAGLEEQVTIWGYTRPANEALGNTIFKRFRFIFKGTAATKDTTKFTKMYIGHWVDPDLGEARDDHVGVDSALGLGYVYNAQNEDTEYSKFNLSPPAIGYLMLQGPIVPSAADTARISFINKYGYKNLPVTSFSYHATGDNYGDPPFTLNGAWQNYSQLMGLPPTPQPPPFPPPLINPISNSPTRFWLDGDPVTSTGWNDGKQENAGDRRFFLSTGPFEMSVNDTQEVVFALIGASASDRTGNITLLKDYARSIKRSYAEQFSVVVPTFGASVKSLTDSTTVVSVTATAPRGAFRSHSVDLVRNNGAVISTLTLFDDGAHSDGGFNDGLFANSDTIAVEPALISIRGRSTDMQGAVSTYENAVRQVSVPGALTQIIPEIYYDNIDNNGKASRGEYVRFGLNVKNSTPFLLRGLTAVPVNSLNIGSSHMFKNLTAGEQSMMKYDPLDPTSYFTIRIPASANNEFEVSFIFRDSAGNKWNTPVVFPLHERLIAQDTIRSGVVDIEGKSDVSIEYVLHNPDKVGMQYDMLFGGGLNKNETTGLWTLINVDSTGPYLTLKCVIGEQKSLPYNRGDGLFELNRNKDSLRYSIKIRNLYGPFISGYLRVDTARIKTLQFIGDSAVGWMTKYDSVDRWNDSLVSKFKKGLIEVVTEYGGGYTFNGFVGNGLIPRQSVYKWPSNTYHDGVPRSPITPSNEVIADGFSIYATMYPPGIKDMFQTAPDTLRLLSIPHPSRNYTMGTNNPIPGKNSSKEIKFHFNGVENWAIAVPIVNSSPVLARAIRVPFAVYLDTTRVWPTILKKNLATDTTWRMDDTLNSGEIIFDMILGIADEYDGNNRDLRYYSPTNFTFPPTSTTIKSRIMISSSHVAREIYFENTKGDMLPPPVGTWISMPLVKYPHNGDIKRITLKRASADPGSFPVVPATYVLENNFPNPFNPATNIRYGVPRRSYVTLAVFDILGRKIRTLVAGESLEGTFTVRWDGRDDDGRNISSGVYFYRMTAGSYVMSKKMILLK
jgi:hypothetical protein